ncbi:MAG: hypothetical protein WAO28_04580 [Candidatus Microsaccharimonas sp.]
MDVDQTQLEKARIWAYWGFVGFMFPIAGIIASAISISILQRLVMDEDDEEGIGEHARIMNMANATRVLSVVLLIAMIIGAIFVTTQIVEAQNSSPVNEYYQRILEAADEN